MKKVFIILISLVVFYGCGDKDTETPKVADKEDFNFDSTDLSLAPLTDDAIQKVVLKYSLKKGDNYRFRLTTITDENQTIEADTVIRQNVSQTIVYLISMDVKDLDDDKVMEINTEIKSVKLDAISNGEKFAYLSGSKMDSVERMNFIEYESLINNPFTIRVNPDGEIMEIFKADKIANKYLELRGMKDSVSVEEKKLFQQDIINAALKPLLAQVFRKLPNTEVGKDSSWNLKMPPADLQVFKIDNTHTYKLTNFEKLNDDNIALIEAGLISQFIINPEAKKNNIDVKKPKYTASGKIFFNLSKGIIQKSKTTTSMNVELSMPVPTQKGMQKVTRKQNSVNNNILELL